MCWPRTGDSAREIYRRFVHRRTALKPPWCWRRVRLWPRTSALRGLIAPLLRGVGPVVGRLCQPLVSALGFLVGANYIPSNADQSARHVSADDVITGASIRSWAGPGRTGLTACGSSCMISSGLRMPGVSTIASRSLSPSRRATASGRCLSSSTRVGIRSRSRSAARAEAGVHNSGWVQSPAQNASATPATSGSCTTTSPPFRPIPQRQPHSGWDSWNEPDNPARVHQKVQRKDKQERVAELPPRCSAGPVRSILLNADERCVAWCRPGRTSGPHPYQRNRTEQRRRDQLPLLSRTLGLRVSGG